MTGSPLHVHPLCRPGVGHVNVGCVYTTRRVADPIDPRRGRPWSVVEVTHGPTCQTLERVRLADGTSWPYDHPLVPVPPADAPVTKVGPRAVVTVETMLARPIATIAGLDDVWRARVFVVDPRLLGPWYAGWPRRLEVVPGWRHLDRAVARARRTRREAARRWANTLAALAGADGHDDED